MPSVFNFEARGGHVAWIETVDGPDRRASRATAKGISEALDGRRRPACPDFDRPIPPIPHRSTESEVLGGAPGPPAETDALDAPVDYEPGPNRFL